MNHNKSFRTCECRQCGEKIERVDREAVSALCWRCTVKLSRGLKGECEDEIFSFRFADQQKNPDE